MSAFLAIVRKQLVEARWFLGLVSVAMFGLGWLGVYQTKAFQILMTEARDGMSRVRGAGMMRFFGGPSYDDSTLAMEIARWNFPLIPLLVLCWAIARGSAAIAGEIERGTLDIVLSRPVSRLEFLAAQVASALLGLAIILAALLAGNQLANLYYELEDAPALLPVLRPCLNLFALGMSVFGYTMIFSSFDVVRWRATLIGSSLTIGGIIGYMVAISEELKENWGWLEWSSVFRGYAPVEAAVVGEQLGPNVAALCGVGAAGILIGAWFFARRDLPSNS